ncbi:MAG TPA: DUF551 domain-containing protein [Clostridiales bacterium]|nr:DUF551 domain-containing protein [Clostridiales bacterium]
MNKQEIEKAMEILEQIYPSQKEIKTGEYDHVADALDTAISALQLQLTGGWIPVSERLPEEKINPVTSDYFEYECTAYWGYGRVDVRHYKFGDGHWWNSPSCVDAYVVAWRERPEPYKEEL